jgi:Rieske Fe-S protein
VLATNSPIGDDGKITKRQKPFRTYAFAAEAPKGAIEDALYWDTERPYHYVRLQPAGDVDLLISGGEDHGSAHGDEAERHFAELEAWTKERFPEIGRVRQRWSGQVLEPEDFVGFIGLQPGRGKTWVVSGDSGQGITHSVAASLILPALIDGGRHEWAEAYDPARKPPKKEVGKEDRSKETEDDIGSADQLSPGEGGILSQGRTKLAVSRDEGGRLYRISAECTHLGCTVHWNSFEQCWDCPCHGSHFSPDGTAINAPAVEPLEPVKEETDRKKAREAAR